MQRKSIWQRKKLNCNVGSTKARSNLYKERWSIYSSSEETHIGLKQQGLCAHTLFTHWMLAALVSICPLMCLQRRYVMMELKPVGCLLTTEATSTSLRENLGSTFPCPLQCDMKGDILAKRKLCFRNNSVYKDRRNIESQDKGKIMIM